LGVAIGKRAGRVAISVGALRPARLWRFVPQRSLEADGACELGQAASLELNAPLHPAPDPDPNARLILNRYARKRQCLNRRGVFAGRPALALITRDRERRKATSYRDLDFYLDDDRSAHRPAFAVDALRQRPNFGYRSGLLALSFVEDARGVVLDCLDLANHERVTLRAQRLLLACGALGTARIVLRSRGRERVQPLLCNPYTHVASVLFGMVGRPLPARRTSLVQLVMFHEAALGENFDVAQASFYSYGSLLLSRLLAALPLNFRDALPLMRWLVSGLVIVGIHHPTSRGGRNRLYLVPDAGSVTGDRLRIDYELDAAEGARNARRERLFLRVLLELGCHPLKRFHRAHGASLHYAGTLPFGDGSGALGQFPDGRLHGGKRVYVVDGSGFRYLPAKGVTFSLMANARRVAIRALADG
jgi:hypothetical protein